MIIEFHPVAASKTPASFPKTKGMPAPFALDEGLAPEVLTTPQETSRDNWYQKRNEGLPQGR
jgi:hypothetical protein